jgi:hypothetical protein
MVDTYALYRRLRRLPLGTRVFGFAFARAAPAAMGLLAEASVPVTHRWIPRGMEVR